MLSKQNKSISFGVWFQYVDKPEKEWRAYFQKYKNAGIINYFIQGNPSQLKKLIIITKGMELTINAWVWTLNGQKDEVAIINLVWYSVKRKGQNIQEFRQQVIYNQWISQFSGGAGKQKKKNITKFFELVGFAFVN